MFKKVSSLYHLCINSFKQWFPHQSLLSLEDNKTKNKKKMQLRNHNFPCQKIYSSNIAFIFKTQCCIVSTIPVPV